MRITNICNFLAERIIYHHNHYSFLVKNSNLIFANLFMFYIYLIFAEPESGFQIAFNMFDTDGNQRVDKNEFLVVSYFG